MSRGMAALLALALVTLAQPAWSVSLSLEDDWRYQVGDDPAWAAPDLPDADWPELALPEGGTHGPPPSSIVWYRKRVRVSALEAPALVLGGGVATAYEVYVDGERVGAYGDVEGEREAPSSAQVYPLSQAAFEDGELVIAIRCWQLFRATEWGPGSRWLAGPFAVGERETLEARADAASAKQFQQVTVMVGVGFVLLVVGVFHLLLWWRRRELTAYLWYGLFIVGMGSQNLLFLRGEPVWPHYSMATDGFLQPFQVAIVNGAAWELVFSMFAYRRPRWWSAVWLVLGAKAALIAWPASYTTAIQIDRVVGVASLPILVGLVGWRAIKGQRAARIVAVGMLVLLAVAALMLSAQTAFFTVVFGFSPIVPATLVFVGAMAYALADQFSANLVRLDSAYTAAKRFVPADFLTLLGRSEVVDVQRGDATQRQMTVLFADVRGFSTRSEKHTPEENFAWLNRYLESIEPAIRDNRGFVNQYYGDGIMALFDSADDAVRAALAMLVAVAPLRIGIGVHTGPLMLGTIGGRDRLDTGVVGDAVNTASRIESLTKQYERPLLISDATKAALTDHDDLRFEEIDRVAPKGKRQHITLYAVALGA